jgi:hypothetical protein
MSPNRRNTCCGGRPKLAESFKQQQSEMQEHFGALQKEKQEHQELENKLAAMEAKVMKGGTNLLDQVGPDTWHTYLATSWARMMN